MLEFLVYYKHMVKWQKNNAIFFLPPFPCGEANRCKLQPYLGRRKDQLELGDEDLTQEVTGVHVGAGHPTFPEKYSDRSVINR